MKRKKIVIISGSGRTGSTLLSLLLSQHRDVFNLGQLRDLWKSYLRDEPCSCGNKLSACPVYARAVPIVFGPDAATTLDEMQRLMRAFFAQAKKHRDWSDPAVLQRLRENHAPFIERLNRFLDVLQGITGTGSFVDTSKSPEMALAFSLMEETEARVVNLVRDPRAVACSWQQKLKSIKAAASYSRQWADRQRVLEAWGRHLGQNFLQVRYEDLARAPNEIVERILQWAGLARPERLFVTPNQAAISWDRQHLFPPANERVLTERKTDVVVTPAESWRAFRNLPMHCIAVFCTYPEGLRYIRHQS